MTSRPWWPPRPPRLRSVPAMHTLDELLDRWRIAQHVQHVTRLGRAPYERVITHAARAFGGPWDGVLTHCAVVNGAAR